DALKALGRQEEALVALRKALSLAPNNTDILTALGNQLRVMDRYEEAKTCHARAVELMSAHADLVRNLGVTLAAAGETSGAIECDERALRITPPPEPEAAKGLLLLQEGRFAEGWPFFERRRNRDAPDFMISAYPVPRWNGERMDGALVVWGEEGLGDQILYASMIAEARARVGSLVLELEPRLVKLFARSFPDVDVIPMKPELYAGKIEAHCPMGGLGLHLRRSWGDFPKREDGYLRADSEHARALRERLTGDGRKVFG